MGCFSPSFSCSAMGALILGCLLLQASNSHAQLRPDFYFGTCPRVFNIIGNIIVDELGSDPRIAASILRLHFHDCFVNGCDASILLDNSTSFRTEKDAAPNANSARGFNVIDRMKTEIERACPRTVSCADVLTIASQISVLLTQVNDCVQVSLVDSDLNIPGLFLLPDFITAEEEQQLLAAVDTQPWIGLAKRCVQHYGCPYNLWAGPGYEFCYGTRNVDTKKRLGELPSFVSPILKRISRFSNLDCDLNLDQLTVNEYPSGVGLSPHIDTHSAFEDYIFSLSLAGPCIMEFRRYFVFTWKVASTTDEEKSDHPSCIKKALYLPPRSMLLLSGEARYAWNHYIPHHKSGGPWWPVPLGRRDSLRAFFDLANTALPSPFFTLAELKKSFADVGLNRASDLVALSGGHTFGRAQCQFVTPRLYNFNGTNRPDPSLNPTYLAQLRGLCPQNGNGTVLVNFDPVTPDTFDSQYYTNLRNGKGLIQSDQELFSTPQADTVPLVEQYSRNTNVFFQAFVEAMIRMGNLKPLTGTQGEIRLNCRIVNSRIRSVENEDNGVVSSI